MLRVAAVSGCPSGQRGSQSQDVFQKPACLIVLSTLAQQPAQIILDRDGFDVFWAQQARRIWSADSSKFSAS